MKYHTLFFLNPCDIGDFLWREADLPFVPTEGLLIDLDGEFRKVKEVFYLAGKNRLEVYFEDDRMCPQQLLLEQGWQIDR
jgi:hypothetical protein